MTKMGFLPIRSCPSLCKDHVTIASTNQLNWGLTIMCHQEITNLLFGILWVTYKVFVL